MQFGQLLRLVDQHREKQFSDVKEKASRVMIRISLQKEAVNLVRWYNDLDIEVLEDEDELDKNKKITALFISDCHTKAGRERIRVAIKQIRDDGKYNEYTYVLEGLLTLIDNIYGSLVYKELDSENKPIFLFRLDQKKVRDKLADRSVPKIDKMERIISCVESFITRIGNALKNSD